MSLPANPLNSDRYSTYLSQSEGGHKANGSQLTRINPSRRVFLVGSMLAGACLAAPWIGMTRRTAAASGIQSVVFWEDKFLSMWNKEDAGDTLELSRSGDGWDLYNLAYAIDGLTAMFEATAKTIYLDRALSYISNVIATARPSSTLPISQFKDGYYGWTTKSLGEQGLYESYCWRYVTRLLRLMKSNAAVYNNPTYKSRFNAILSFTEKNIFDKWRSRGVSSWIYRENTHMASHWAYISINLATLTDSPARRAACLQIVDNINWNLPNFPGCGLRKQLIAHPVVQGGIFWNSNWGRFGRPGSDVGHGGNTVSYLVEAAEHQRVFTVSDMRKLLATLNNAIWKPNGSYAAYVDGSGMGNGWLNEGWCKLGRYSAALQQRLETHNVGRNMQLYGNGALNARILLRGS